MKFDKSRVYTALNADELKVGSKVVLSCILSNLKRYVEDNEIVTLTDILGEDEEYRFVSGNDCGTFAYLVEEPKINIDNLKLGDKLVNKGKNKEGVVTFINHNSPFFVNIGGYCYYGGDLDGWELSKE